MYFSRVGIQTILLLSTVLTACGSDTNHLQGDLGPIHKAGIDASNDVISDGESDAIMDSSALADSPAFDVLDTDTDSSDAVPDIDVGPQSIELIDDNRFLNGFNTYPAQPSTTPIAKLIPPTATMKNPSWDLIEWHTKQLLAIRPPKEVSSGFQWANNYKRVIINNGFLELGINADAEYSGKYRLDGENSRYFLVQQKIYDDSSSSYNVPIYKYTSVTLKMDLRLVYTNHIRELGYDPALHSCQFMMLITLQNWNKEHPYFGNYIWFALPIYDDRHPSVEQEIINDSNTNQYLFQMASEDIMPASLHNQSHVPISVDLLPYMKMAVQDAISRGSLKSLNLNDYFLGSMTMGFEVSGRSVATMTVRDLSLTGVR